MWLYKQATPTFDLIVQLVTMAIPLSNNSGVKSLETFSRIGESVNPPKR